MKNTLSISSDGINCTCDCVDIIADGTNSIFIALNVGNVSNPRFKLWKNNTLQSTTTLTTGITNYIEIPTALFTANAVITFQYLDNTYTGEIFIINFPNVLIGNLTVIKNSDRVYSANYKINDVGELQTSGYFRKRNNIVSFAMSPVLKSQLVNCPEGFRPPQDIWFMGCVQNLSTKGYYPAFIQIKRDGSYHINALTSFGSTSLYDVIDSSEDFYIFCTGSYVV